MLPSLDGNGGKHFCRQVCNCSVHVLSREYKGRLYSTHNAVGRSVCLNMLESGFPESACLWSLTHECNFSLTRPIIRDLLESVFKINCPLGLHLRPALGHSYHCLEFQDCVPLFSSINAGHCRYPRRVSLHSDNVAAEQSVFPSYGGFRYFNEIIRWVWYHAVLDRIDLFCTYRFIYRNYIVGKHFESERFHSWLVVL